jgi:hypothetical protein
VAVKPGSQAERALDFAGEDNGFKRVQQDAENDEKADDGS